MLIMGGFGHSRFKEIILGDTTLHVLHNTDIPFLVMH